MNRALVLAIAALALAGCAQAPAPTTAAPVEHTIEPARPAHFTESTGGLEGMVTTEEAVPIVAATIVMAGVGQTFSDMEGRFSFSDIPPGTYTIAAAANGHEPSSRRVDIQAGSARQANIVLFALPSTEPHHLSQHRSGEVGCWVMTALPDDTNPSTALTNHIGADPCSQAGITQNPRSVFNVTPEWNNTVDWLIEAAWRSSNPIAVSLSFWETGYYSLAIGPENNTNIDTASTWWHGGPPLAIHMTKSYIDWRLEHQPSQPSKSHGRGCAPQLPNVCRFQVDVQGWADTVPTITIQQRYELWLTSFYYAGSEPGFSALPDA